jgi:vancomycin resistance protein YoaR
MVVQASGSSLGRHGDDEDGQDERKEKKRMQDELSRLQAEAEDHKRDKQDMYLKLLQEQERRDKAESNLRLEQAHNAHNFTTWQQGLDTAKEELRLECAAHQRAQAATKIDLQTERNKRQRAQNATAGLHAEIDHFRS